MSKENSVDIIKTYLLNIGKYDLLDKKEEQILAKRIKRYQKVLISRVLESQVGRSAITEAAENYVKSNLKRSDIFETCEDEDSTAVNDADSSIKKTAMLMIDLCKHYVDDTSSASNTANEVNKSIITKICNIHLATNLLNNICYLINTKSKLEGSKVKEVNDRILKAKNELITKNLKLVIMVAKDYRNRGVDYEDLIQEGNIGLMKAVNKFDYHKGTRFSTYAYWWIRQSITRSIAESSRTIRIPVYLVEHFYKVSRVMNDLISTYGDIPTPEEIAVKADLTLDQVNKALESMSKVMSLDSSANDNSDNSRESLLIDAIEDRSTPSPEQSYSNGKLSKLLEETIQKKLTPKEQMILKLRFGLDKIYDDDHTLEVIGSMYNVTKERIRQIESKSLSKLRKVQSLRELIK